MKNSGIPLSAFHFIAFGFIATLLTACTVIDPGFDQLEAVAEASPRRDAIVGMWHRNDDDSFGMTRARFSRLFLSNGTGMSVNRVGDWKDETDFRWTYQGNGQWAVSYPEHPGAMETVKLAQGKLLVLFGQSRTIYERVQP